MRAPTVLAAVALTGAVLFGGAGQALADDTDNTSSAGFDFGTSAPATPGSGQDEPSFGQDASGFGQDASGFGDDASGFGQDESGFGQSADD
ncbi:hypothetical protein [Streptomyces lanatus]|uniref:Secreted protein n=1 Tax=Streptomyces lanatus TaxID=66900 RepID=A0ABV1XXS2_9ACTN|nr:hypothetical protein [Streptomyces lanatus]GHG90375.1 hypothetical protein GCM10018780_10480 [Streptomyces lanatus]